jgi:NAD(P)-dependent dehydrogenase (short-subunit alcohol dehydrogenase family)
MANFQGKKVVVIGGTSGIGFAVASAAHDDGAQVIVASSQQAKVDAAVKQLGAKTSGSALDVKNEDAVKRFFGDVGRFDHLVFTAGDWGRGTLGGGSVQEMDLAAAARTFAARFWGALAAIKHGSGASPKADPLR